jgi:hypothetical protein
VIYLRAALILASYWTRDVWSCRVIAMTTSRTSADNAIATDGDTDRHSGERHVHDYDVEGVARYGVCPVPDCWWNDPESLD